jgi:hypothetical protein
MDRKAFLCLSFLVLVSSADIAGADEMTDSMMPAMSHQALLPDPLAELGPMEVWDQEMQMAMPFPMKGMEKSTIMLMIHGYGFFETVAEEGAKRGRTDFAGPNMLMIDLGSTVSRHEYFNIDLMLTSELWTVASTGTPELLQIGEEQKDGTPFLDAQHPHSSPIMGLTFSDTIALADDKSNLKLFFAPRGESTDGPIPFMHRVTGMVNPDAPLGHHVGQDVGHISSTVLGESLKLGGFHLEMSTFNGSEPSPTQVDLPMGPLNSFAVRVIQDLSPQFSAMASYAWVGTPEPGVADAERFSGSLYAHLPLSADWTFHTTLIYGGITHIDNASFLSSFSEEFLLNTKTMNLFARFEELQRTPNQLQVPGLTDPDNGRWVSAFTVGYSHQVAAWDGWQLSAGLSVTNDMVPAEYSGAYEGNPFTYKFFFQLGGSQMYNL